MTQAKVRLTLLGLDGNAFCLIGAFRRAAKKQGWPMADIEAVINECMEGDYDHLLRTLMKNCEDEE